jgi:hypothetical protein
MLECGAGSEATWVADQCRRSPWLAELLEEEEKHGEEERRERIKLENDKFRGFCKCLPTWSCIPYWLWVLAWHVLEYGMDYCFWVLAWHVWNRRWTI